LQPFPIARAFASSVMATAADVFLRLKAAHGLLQQPGSPEHVAASRGQSDALLAMLAGTQLDPQDMVAIAAQVSAVSWASEQERSALLEAVSRAIRVPAVGVRAKQQNFEMVSGYLTERQWQTMLNESVNFAVKLQTLADHCKVLGLRSPTEPTAAKVASLLLICSEGSAKARCLQPAYLRDVFLHVKSCLKPSRHTAPHIETVIDLPADVADFRMKCPQTWDAVFSSAPPVPCKLPLSEIVAVAQNLQMRSRKKTNPLSASSLGGDAVATAISQAVTNVFRNMLGGTSMPANPITILSTPRQGRLRTSWGSVEDFAARTPTLGQLAIGDAIAPPPVPSSPPPVMPTTPQAADRTTPIATAAKTTDVAMDTGASDEDKASPPPAKNPKHSIEEAAAKILSCMTCKTTSKPTKKKPSKSTKKKPAAAATVLPCPSSEAKPSYSIERSRSQVLYRSGLRGCGQTKVFKYNNDATMEKAIKQAKALVSAECARRGL
jgi:hypothetical protein